MSTQVGTLRAFENLGFRREAVLRDHVQDVGGHKHNLVIMINNVAELWQGMQDLIDRTDSGGEY
jgi:hypothetical protein